MTVVHPHGPGVSLRRTNGDLLLEPVRRLLEASLPYSPRVEVPSLGEAAVLSGALAVARRSALDNVFVNRSSALV